MRENQGKHAQLKRAERHPMALKAGDAAADVGYVEILAGSFGVLALKDKLDKAPEPGRRGRRHPADQKIAYLRELADEDAVDQRDKKKNEKFPDLRPAAPGIRAHQIGGNCPGEQGG